MFFTFFFVLSAAVHVCCCALFCCLLLLCCVLLTSVVRCDSPLVGGFPKRLKLLWPSRAHHMRLFPCWFTFRFTFRLQSFIFIHSFIFFLGTNPGGRADNCGSLCWWPKHYFTGCEPKLAGVLADHMPDLHARRRTLGHPLCV